MKGILLLLFAISLICCTKKHPTEYFKTTTLDITNSDNSGLAPVDAGMNVAARSYALKMEFTNQVIGELGDKKSSILDLDDILSFDVHALENFDSTHAALRSLNEYFLVSNGGTPYSTIMSVGNMIGKQSQRGVTSWAVDQYLILMKQPDSLGTYNFVIDIKYSDGRHLTDTTNVNLL